jgi:hypothetical protein
MVRKEAVCSGSDGGAAEDSALVVSAEMAKAAGCRWRGCP